MPESKYRDFNENIPIWRYMPLKRLVQIFETSTLYFPSARQFEDPYEGSIPTPNAIGRFKRNNPRASERIQDYQQPSLLSMDAYEDLTQWMKVSCWHVADHESAAMWKLYSHGEKDSIVISTTTGRLMAALSEYRIKPGNSDEPMIFGEVSYLDYAKQEMPNARDIDRFFHKRNCFESEREFRVIVSLTRASEFVGDTPREGISVAVDLNLLIDSISISPLCDFDTVAERLRQLGESVRWRGDILRSSIASTPIF